MNNFKGIVKTVESIHGAVVVKGDHGKSAYQYAVEQGYQGTEEEYAALMATVPEYGQRINDIEDVNTAQSAVIASLTALGLYLDADGDVAQHDYFKE